MFCALFAGMTVAQIPGTQPAAEEPSSPFSFTLGVDFTTDYYFRGIAQENQGFIAQPYATIAYTFYEGDGWLNNMSASLGTWNSIHSGPTGEGDDPSSWYESDVLASVSATVAEKWTLTLGYVAYLSPNDSYNTYQEISLAVAYDDTDLLGRFALHPRALIAFEIDDQADAGNSAFVSTGTSEGIYLELGIAPELPLGEADGAWKLVFPATLGLSLSDYYETSDGDDDFFGYVDVGAELVVPLKFLNTGGAEWTLRGGPHLLWLGDNASEIGSGITGGDDFDVWGKIGISVSF
jgi:hypothetical protein